MPYCLDCARVTSHGLEGKKMAALGYVGCSQKPAGLTRSIASDMECEQFQPAASYVVEKNRAWAAQVSAKRKRAA